MREIDLRKLKSSVYNRYISKNETNLVFNTRSLSLIRLDEEQFCSLKGDFLTSFNNDELEKLFQMNFVNSLSDERKEVVKEHFFAKNSDRLFRLTIFTTTNCNARCHYCFQQGVKRLTPTRKEEDDIVDLLLQHKDKHIHLKWFGGEPLLNVGMIDRISKRLDDLGLDYSSNMITNGYLISKNIGKISAWKLTHIQITLDGINEKYNSIKRYVISNDPNPFETVINGIKLLLERKINVSIRLNFDKNNFKDIEECIDYLHQTFGNPKNLSVYCHNIFGPKENYHLPDGTNVYSIIIKKLLECGYIKDLSQLGIKNRPLPCSAYSPYFYVVDAVGKLLKCEHYIPTPSYSGVVGDLTNGITNEVNYNYWLDRGYPYKECPGCDVLPICQGGCRFEALDNLGNGSCLSFRDCLDDLIFEYYVSKSKLPST